ncbi:hypothetical protein [Trichloromonas sp.]|uniref:hypothetical protein n=1 Tax=Trichloromonas sp. TaxID=3069249 RepID=UPI003D814111
MSWYHVSLSPEEVAEGLVQECSSDFSAAFTAANAPRMMAFFQRESQGGGLELFFTPDCGEHAASVLEKWNCSPCDPPPMAGLHLLGGFNEITYYLY